MKLEIEIELDGEAFRDDTGAEAARVLNMLAHGRRILTLGGSWPGDFGLGDAYQVRDSRGDICGLVQVTE